MRLFYYDGTIEMLMPGQDHEIYKSIIGMLLEIYLVEREIEFWPTGSMTQEQEGEVSAQADESYCLQELKPVPDLSIEVVFTSGGSNKLARYRALGVPEVWFWQDGLFTFRWSRSMPGYEGEKLKVYRLDAALWEAAIEILHRRSAQRESYQKEVPGSGSPVPCESSRAGCNSLPVGRSAHTRRKDSIETSHPN